MIALEHALVGLRQALEAPRRHQSWRWLVRQRMAGVKDALTTEPTRDGDAAPAAREPGLEGERLTLLRRLTDLGPEVLAVPDVEDVRHELLRLLDDAERHRQRLDDLVYDSVSPELGGSE